MSNQQTSSEQYLLDEKIGSGRCCRVFAGYCGSNGSKCALKMFKPSDGDYFLNEIAVYHTLKSHPNIVDYIGAYAHLTEGDKPKLQSVIILKYYNDTLRSLMKRYQADFGDTGFPHVRAARYAKDIISGLQYMHDNNVIYGDMKLPNLFVTLEDTIKLGDFSSSSLNNKPFTRTCGTINFIPPELLLCQNYDKSVDIWMFVCCLYQLYTGTPLFDIDNLYNINYDCLASWPSIDKLGSISGSSDTCDSGIDTDDLYTESEDDGEETDLQFLFVVMEKLLGPAPIKYFVPYVHIAKKKSKTCTIARETYDSINHLTAKKITLSDLIRVNFPYIAHRDALSHIVLQGLVYEPAKRANATRMFELINKLTEM